MNCLRCREPFGDGEFCEECGVHHARPVRKPRRNRPIGGKRGRNSGTTNKSKAKGGG